MDDRGMKTFNLAMIKNKVDVLKPGGWDAIP